MVTHFRIRVLVKKSSTKLFVITNKERENTRAYLKRFNTHKNAQSGRLA
jgi:hypothetical protein